jgi:alpha-D-xyloside xylohydrolase
MKKPATIILFAFVCLAFLSCGKQKGHYIIELPGYSLQITPITSSIIHIQTTPDGHQKLHKSLIVEDLGKISEPVRHTFKESTDLFWLETSDLKIEIEKPGGRITFLDKSGKQILAEPHEPWERHIPVEFDGDKGFTIKQKFVFDTNEAIYGFGQHQNGIMNYRGKSVELLQHNKESVVPFFLSSKGYGILWDNYAHTIFNDTDVHASLWSEMGDGLDYYFVLGANADEVISGYRALTGQAPMLPRYAFGYIQSKERYKSQQELIDVVTRFRLSNIPIDIIVQDWRYWIGENWGQKTFDPERFPDPAALTATLQDSLNTRLMISIWPKLDSITDDFKELREFMYGSPGSQFVYDAFNPVARDIYWKQAYNGLFRYGIDAWWCDATEPEIIGWDHSTETQKKYMKPYLGSAARYMNAYSLMHSKGIYENQRKVTDQKRVVNLTRSAFAGQQAYSSITWTGDVMGNWDGLRDQITAGLNFSMSGIPWWTMDIGGFFVFPIEQWTPDRIDPEFIEDPEYRELYLRWLQFGAFCPLFRSHGTNLPREPWCFGTPGDEIYDGIVKFIELRYQLMPYIYSQAWKVSSEGYTMMRGLVMDFPHDKKVFEITDQYMFGEALLVCPVTKYGARSREVYLPEHTAGWYNFFTGEHFDGGQTITVDAQLSEMPIFVKGGSILPFTSVTQYTQPVNFDNLQLLVYPGADATFTFYDDEGDGYNYEQGQFYTIRLNWDDQKSSLTALLEGDDKMAPSSFSINIVDKVQGFDGGFTTTGRIKIE